MQEKRRINRKFRGLERWKQRERKRPNTDRRAGRSAIATEVVVRSALGLPMTRYPCEYGDRATLGFPLQTLV